MTKYNNSEFFDFLIRKEIPFECLEEDFANFAGEDSFNSDIAEKALEIAFDLYPDKPGEDEDDTMEKRHEFVDEFLEYARCEVVKKWASNLGMYTKEEAQANVDTQRKVCKDYWTNIFNKKMAENSLSDYNAGYDEGVNDTLKKFRNMSSYAHSKWKREGDPVPEKFDPCELDIHYDSSMKNDSAPSEYQPQDSEDEAWEQMRAMNNHHQDI